MYILCIVSVNFLLSDEEMALLLCCLFYINEIASLSALVPNLRGLPVGSLWLDKAINTVRKRS